MADSILMTLLINTLVFSALFCVMLIVRKLTLKKISPVLMLALWFVVVLKLMIPFGFESRLSILPQNTGAGTVQQYNTPWMPSPAEAVEPSGETADTDSPGVNNVGSANILPAVTADASINGAAPAAGIDWKTIALGAWGAGALVTGAFLCLSGANIKKRIRHSRAVTPQHVLEIFEDCRQTLGVRRNIGVVTQSAIDKPVIMGLLKPMLVLPESAAEDAQALKYIFMHELTHYKWGDLWAIKLMNILRPVYWFNPLVWVCFRLIRSDMEIACDRKVINVVGEAHRLPYIGTVLSFAGSKTPGLPAAAMGLSDGRPAMEKRIRGIFGKVKTGLGGRIAAALLAVLLLAAGVLTACQPVLPLTVPAAAYETTGHWKDSIQDEKLTIKIDADITQPKVSEYPVVTVEPVIFSQQRVNELVNYFAKGKKLYKRHGWTKADYAEQIAWLNEGTWLGGKKVVTADMQVMIKEREQEMASAPESYPKEYIDSTLTYDIEYIDNFTLGEYEEAGKNFVNARVENGDGNDGSIGVRNFTKDYDESTCFYYGTGTEVYTPKTAFDAVMSSLEANTNAESASDDRKNWQIDELAVLYENVTLKQEDAQSVAEKAISDLGIKDLTLTTACKTVSLDYPDKGGWQFEYARQNGGIAVTGFSEITNPNIEEPSAYEAFYPGEKLTILVTEDGIQSFNWYGCVKRKETVSENSELLPLEDIKQALIKSIANAKSTEKAHQSETVEVTSARLCMGYIRTNDPMKFKVVPVWAFKTMDSYSAGQYLDLSNSAYVINAIDGDMIVY